MCVCMVTYFVVMVGMEGEGDGEGGWTILTAEVMTLHFMGVLSTNPRLQEKEDFAQISHIHTFLLVLYNWVWQCDLKITGAYIRLDRDSERGNIGLLTWQDSILIPRVSEHGKVGWLMWQDYLAVGMHSPNNGRSKRTAAGAIPRNGRVQNDSYTARRIWCHLKCSIKTQWYAMFHRQGTETVHFHCRHFHFKPPKNRRPWTSPKLLFLLSTLIGLQEANWLGCRRLPRELH